MTFIKEFLKKDIVKRLLVLIGIIVFLYLLRGMLNLFLLTFLFTYVTYSMQKAITTRLDKYIKINQAIVTIFIYVILIVVIAFVVYKYIPLMIDQIGEIAKDISKFDVDSLGGPFVSKYVMPYVKEIDVKSIVKGTDYKKVLDYVANVGAWSFNVFVALILSLFFMLEKQKLKAFMSRFASSRVAGVYKYAKEFGKKFLNSFGKVIQAQLIIAFTNSILSTCAFYFMGFPQILGLGVMIFMFSLVPVAGTIVSLVPLVIIAYKVGKIIKVIYVLILIAFLHGFESYVLNPKFMSDKTELPVFLVFVTLLISEHFMGVWGLLLGVPLFMFMLDFLDVTMDEDIKTSKELEMDENNK